VVGAIVDDIIFVESLVEEVEAVEAAFPVGCEEFALVKSFAPFANKASPSPKVTKESIFEPLEVCIKERFIGSKFSANDPPDAPPAVKISPLNVAA
jgi:hypothetical protein